MYLEHIRDGTLEVVPKEYKQELGTIRDGCPSIHPYGLKVPCSY